MKRKSQRSSFVTVTTTVETRALAGRLARLIVDMRLAACVQYSAISSIYRWKGKVESAGEFLLVAKTRKELARKLAAFIKANHPYEVPEIVIGSIAGGSKSYLDWIWRETAE